LIATIFTFIFALACLAMFLLGMRKQWASARVAAALIAILSFLIALLSAKMTATH
jgi:hypothetical protein